MVGYEDTTSSRQIFKRQAGLTPAAYRRKFARIVLKELVSPVLSGKMGNPARLNGFSHAAQL